LPVRLALADAELDGEHNDRYLRAVSRAQRHSAKPGKPTCRQRGVRREMRRSFP